MGDSTLVRGFLPDLIGWVLSGCINPGRVFDLTSPLDQAAEGRRAMDDVVPSRCC